MKNSFQSRLFIYKKNKNQITYYYPNFEYNKKQQIIFINNCTYSIYICNNRIVIIIKKFNKITKNKTKKIIKLFKKY